MSSQRHEVTIWLLGVLLAYLGYRACLAVYERIFFHIGAIEVTSEHVVGLDRGSMAKGGVDPVQNHILDLVVVFFCISDIQPDLMLLSEVDDAIIGGLASIGGVSYPEEHRIFKGACNENWAPVGQGLDELVVD